MKFYFVTWPFEHSQGDSLTKCGAKNRLISYAFCGPAMFPSIDPLRPGFFNEYRETGLSRDLKAEKLRKMSGWEFLKHMEKMKAEGGDDEKK